ncbi:hypothetical protein AQS8620_01291 [Aquimixticola soesokkakensis]|uniref:Uncharacterized protein n=1 Tax=Aquimixticola soesokkakensis TaxID=1519096 RepID=A0A1Y5SBW3_9RHOB|nr:hypothetical protein [Aquimixticola soesokkakensis]SLN36430.1 hypothetical protein AQS8620_01291 [Aquimixticola soesokkakensis]
MTFSDFAPRVRTVAGLIRDASYLIVVVTPALGLMLYGLYVWNRDTIVSTVRSELGIEGLATRENVEQLSMRVGDLTAAVRTASGDDRVIRQPIGMSYVSEPVSVGQSVTLNLVLERTALGERCVFVGGQSLFADATNIVVSGSPVLPQRQIALTATRLRVVLDPPQTLLPGRIELYLALEYDCAGKRVFDRTDVVAYQLLAKG